MFGSIRKGRQIFYALKRNKIRSKKTIPYKKVFFIPVQKIRTQYALLTLNQVVLLLQAFSLTGETTMSKSGAEAIKVSSYGGGGFTINGVDQEEVDVLLGSFKGGFHWVRRGQDGRLEHRPAFEDVPPPGKDESMHPFWSPPGKDEGVQMEMFSLGDKEGAYHRHSSPSILIQHLCGYHYSAENYKKQAEFLEECGFVCMRSRRDAASGQFWELWFLPGMWCAQGRLREAIADSGKKNEKLKAGVAVEFLGRHSQFGTLDIAVQRLAMVPDD